jgi:mRNA-degrading endonuclease toxin of MazEF toxin-antitoxin module
MVPLDCAGQPAVAVVDQIRAVSKQRLHRQMGAISSEHLQAVENALRQILEL